MRRESTENEEKILVVLVEALLNRWGLTADERVAVLGKVDLKNFNEGQRFNDELKLRITQILFIHRCLRLRYPHDRKMVYGWIKALNADFGGKSPLEILMKSGTPNFLCLIEHLEDSKSEKSAFDNVIALGF